MRVFNGVEQIKAAQGEKLGTSDWHTITQEQVDGFAEATGDHQWIHVDPDRAANGPFGGTIAHGYLTLSLLPMLGAEIYRIEGVSMGINYGLNKVRFPQAVRVGSRVRARSDLTTATDVQQGVQLTVSSTIEIEDGEKPACIAETLALVVP